MRDYKRIKAWELVDDLVIAVHKVSKAFPRDELYGLTSQIRRAACSGAANISEGASRRSQKDYLHFLYVARGSVAEVEYFLHLSHRLDFVNAESAQSLQRQVVEAQSCLYGLIRAVEKEAGIVKKVGAKLSSAIALLVSTMHVV